ncbi:MAG: AAA family ATPase [Pirellulales bacterium]
MTTWLGKVFSALCGGPAGQRSTLDSGLLELFRAELKHCENVYRTCGELLAAQGASAVQGDPAKLPVLMADLHRGLLMKIFTEIARCDRQWDPQECELAVELFRHVWQADVGPEALLPALENVAAHSETLKWESLLRPFVSMPGLSAQRAEIQTISLRIANLLAKASGRVLPEEAATLRSLEKNIEQAWARGKREKKGSLKSEDMAGAAVAVTASGGPRTKRASAAAEEKRPAEAPAKPREEVLAEAMRELDGLIGLATVKNELCDLAHFLKVQQQRRTLGLQTSGVTLHMLFYGNPGTGKTTIARIVGRILGGLGILEKGHTVETDRSGLVAEYAGQTGPKVNRVIDDALDGVLFIDEAYSLVAEDGQDQFGAEAVQTLLKRMEDDRARLVVILAGYTEPMECLLRSNPGLSSRFQRKIDFPDYSAAELAMIFEGMCRKNQYALPGATRKKLRAVLEEQVADRDEHFGNARLARNIFEQAIRRMAVRIVDIAPLTRELLTTLEPNDIVCQAEDVSAEPTAA